MTDMEGQTIVTQFELELPADDATIKRVRDDVERAWWRRIGDDRVVVTVLPTTLMRERGKDLAAHIDNQLYQPYDYEPPMVLDIRVVGRGIRDTRTESERESRA